ncbi:MAG: hypothetical protein VX721_00810 [Thermoproteota archaeon]|nr:hypothetical protein [Thermoproteota archaeon]
MSTIAKRKRDITEVVATIVVKQLKYQKPGTTTVLKQLVFHTPDAVQSHGTSVFMHKKKIPSSLIRKETSGLVCVLGMKLKKANSTILEKVKIIEDLKKLIKVQNLSFLEKVNTSEPVTVVNVEVPVTVEPVTVVNAEVKRIFPGTPVQYVTCPMVRCFLAVTHLNRMGDGCAHPVKHILGSHGRCYASNCPFCLHVHGQETL